MIFHAPIDLWSTVSTFGGKVPLFVICDEFLYTLAQTTEHLSKTLSESLSKSSPKSFQVVTYSVSDNDADIEDAVQKAVVRDLRVSVMSVFHTSDAVDHFRILRSEYCLSYHMKVLQGKLYVRLVLLC